MQEQKVNIIPVELFEHKQITKSDLVIYGTINRLKNGFHTSYARLSEWTKLSEATVKRSVPKLIKLGFLKKQKGRIFVVKSGIISDTSEAKSITDDTKDAPESIKPDTLKVSKLIPESITDDTQDGIKPDTHKNTREEYKNKNTREDSRSATQSVSTPPESIKKSLDKYPLIKLSEKDKESILAKYLAVGLDREHVPEGLIVFNDWCERNKDLQKYKKLSNHERCLMGWVVDVLLERERKLMDFERSKNYLANSRG